MDPKQKKVLEDCVFRILKNGDMNMMTESKVRKLAGEETGFDLMDPINRKFVKRVVEQFFTDSAEKQTEKLQEDEEAEKEKRKLLESQKGPPGGLPKRRSLISVEESEDDEDEKRQATKLDTKKPAVRGPTTIERSRHGSSDDEVGRPTRNESSLYDLSEDEDVDEIQHRKIDVKKRPVQMPTKNERSRHVLSDDEEEEEDYPGQDRKRRAVQRPTSTLRSRRDISDDEEEESPERKLNVKKPTVQRPTSNVRSRRDISEDEEEESPDRKLNMKKPTVQRHTRNERSRDDLSDDEEKEDEEGRDRKSDIKKRIVQRSMKNERSWSVLSDDEEDEEEGRTESSRRKISKPVIDDEEDDEDEEERPSMPRLKRKTNDNGDVIICQLSKNRTVTVQDFKGKMLVSIREYYEKDGKLLPSLKGISLTVDQWAALKEGVPDIEAAIKCIKG